MNVFILMVASTIAGGSSVITFQEFNGKAACQKASSALIKTGNVRFAICTEKEL